MLNRSSIIWIVVSVLFTLSNLWAQNPFEKATMAWDASQRASQEGWEKLKCDMEIEWDELEKAQQGEWVRLKAEVEEKWQVFLHSTKKDWVDYNKQRDARSRVDFERGRILFETVVPTDEPDGKEKAEKKIEKQAEKVLVCEKILDNQVVDKDGQRVARTNLKKYLTEEVLPRVKPDPVPLQSADGVKRTKYTAQVRMVPNHIRIRAEKYLPAVKRNAARFNLKPQLVLAIIHTESYFNPMAVSPCNAVGIMQIIPKYAGREAYRFVYDLDRVITPEYLYNPENNIELGSAYLHLLKYKHFSDVRGELKNRYVSICSYNWGPTSMRKKIVDRYPITAMSDGELYAILRRKTPLETREYIKKVIERIPLYATFL